MHESIKIKHLLTYQVTQTSRVVTESEDSTVQSYSRYSSQRVWILRQSTNLLFARYLSKYLCNLIFIGDFHTQNLYGCM
jgi:hypothetical protein